MSDISDSGRTAWRLAAPLRLLLVPALAITLAACSKTGDSGQPEPEPSAAISLEEFAQAASEFNADVTAALENFSSGAALQLVFSAYWELFFPPLQEDGDNRLLPRGIWESTLDKFYNREWTKTGDLTGGELEYSGPLVNWGTEPETTVELAAEVDWERNGKPTTTVTFDGLGLELPRNVSYQLSADGDQIADLTAELEPTVLEFTCAGESGDIPSESLMLSSLLLNGTLGSAADILVEIVATSFETDFDAGTITSAGDVSAGWSGHEVSLVWDLDVASSNLTADNINALFCGEFDDMGDTDLDLMVKLALDEHEFEFRLAASTTADAQKLEIDASLELIDAGSFTVSGTVDFEAELSASDLEFTFSDTTLTWTEFQTKMEEIFGDTLN